MCDECIGPADPRRPRLMCAKEREARRLIYSSKIIVDGGPSFRSRPFQAIGGHLPGEAVDIQP